jgi:ribosomal protein S18 acetylase RimI-like enzyme
VPSLEIHPLSDLRAEAAGLLADRFARQRAAEPLLPEIDDFEAHLPADGHVATRGGEAVAYLGGELDEELRMGRWLFAGHAAREPEALRDLFAVQAGELGVTRFMVTVPATDPELVDIWFRLAFGCQAVWAVREVAAPEPVPFSGTIRPATRDDIEALIDFEEILYGHQAATPSYSEWATPPRDELRKEFEDAWEDEKYLPFVASDGARLVGMLALYRRPEGDLRVPARNIDLAFAATRVEVRGTGAGRALTNFAFDWANANGYRSMTVDWRAVNLLSSRFWPRRGFRPQYLRLYRAVP